MGDAHVIISIILSYGRDCNFVLSLCEGSTIVTLKHCHEKQNCSKWGAEQEEGQSSLPGRGEERVRVVEVSMSWDQGSLERAKLHWMDFHACLRDSGEA